MNDGGDNVTLCGDWGEFCSDVYGDGGRPLWSSKSDVNGLGKVRLLRFSCCCWWRVDGGERVAGDRVALCGDWGEFCSEYGDWGIPLCSSTSMGVVSGAGKVRLVRSGSEPVFVEMGIWEWWDALGSSGVE